MERQIELTAESLWNDVAARLRGALNDQTYSTWFSEVAGLELDGDTFVVAVPNEFTREWIEGHFLDLIRAAVRDSGGPGLRVRFHVDEQRVPAPAPAPQAVPAAVRPLPVEQAPRAELAGINPKYTFDSFVIGSSNRFAHAAALAVAESPAQAYNPLFIYGHTGLGKTHLLHAIANFVTDHGGGLTCRYVTSETFMNDFINSLRDKRIEGFKQRYRTYDVLLIDDVQFFEHKERIQELVCDRFGVTLNELTSERRSQSIVYPRQVAMYLSRELTDSSLPKIGKHFGGRDHTTVIHATSKISRLIREDRSVYNLVQELTARVRQGR